MTSTSDPPAPGSSGRTCPSDRALSSTISTRRDGQHLPQQPRPLLHRGGHLLRGDAEAAQEHLQHLTRLGRVLPLGVAAQVRVQVPVRELRQQPVRGVHRQRRLADPGGPADRRHHHPAATRQPGQPGQLIRPGR